MGETSYTSDDYLLSLQDCMTSMAIAARDGHSMISASCIKFPNLEFDEERAQIYEMAAKHFVWTECTERTDGPRLRWVRVQPTSWDSKYTIRFVRGLAETHNTAPNHKTTP